MGVYKEIHISHLEMLIAANHLLRPLSYCFAEGVTDHPIPLEETFLISCLEIKHIPSVFESGSWKKNEIASPMVINVVTSIPIAKYNITKTLNALRIRTTVSKFVLCNNR
jgi:hypothetical protein